MRLIVSIPTTNRAAVVALTIQDIARQSRLPDLVLVVVADESDIDPAAIEGLPFPVAVQKSERGLTCQRNVALGMLEADDLALFLDDDFVMAPDYLANLERLFREYPDVVMATGTVLADGIHGPGLSYEYGRNLTMNVALPGATALSPKDIYNCYGCNMALRASYVVAHGVRFDQRLKLYGWLEDVDFSRQMAAYGRIVKSAALRGVHLGTKTGRSSGLRLGYSQVANPLYLNRKGTMAPIRVLNIVGRNLISNLVKSVRPEPEVDRLGRLKGNLQAFGDLMRGRLQPERILTFE
ncbi:glycosyltransferase family 2 protein [Ruegeria marina]|uniref:Glycosyltransferase, GT2 family n=1 Tax=Ruegeria marina TaxID=639004 RepID=A0A1G6ICL7_9RHOB|nr:glycosyltransferase [Ruegeria marina]SDC04234.1 Glycosyltransferase, GT2 family [Ruegeria marina]